MAFFLRLAPVFSVDFWLASEVKSKEPTPKTQEDVELISLALQRSLTLQDFEVNNLVQ